MMKEIRLDQHTAEDNRVLKEEGRMSGTLANLSMDQMQCLKMNIQ